MIDDVAFYLLIDAGRTHSAESFFSSINRDYPCAIVPVGKLYRSISDDGVVFEIMPPDFDQFFTHHRLAANPCAEHHGMTGGLHLFQLLHPFLYGKLFLVIVIFGEEVTVLTAKVAAISDINRADSIFRQAQNEKARDVCEAAKFFSQIHN